MYAIEFSDEAIKDLRSFKKREQSEILDGIEMHLRYEPASEARNRKRLRPNETAEWELRLDQYRVFYDVDEVVRIVSVTAIGLKIGNLLRFRGKGKTL